MDREEGKFKLVAKAVEPHELISFESRFCERTHRVVVDAKVTGGEARVNFNPSHWAIAHRLVEAMEES